MRVLVCADKFRGTATAGEIGTAVAAAVADAGGSCVIQPMADGGEGTLDAFGGANRTTSVSGPLGHAVEATWRLSDGLAVIEMARASGLLLAGGAEGNDPIAASSGGTGELIAAAAEAGARRILIGLGGSASTDGGLGALRAMSPLARFRGISMEAACDVRTRFVEAADVFGPQKGASPAQVKLLRRRLERLTQVYAQEHGVDVAGRDRAGAAGGLAGGLAVAGAILADGFTVIAEAVGLYDQIEEADLVFTGEGCLDESSFEGKVVGGVVDLARAAGKPVVVVVGQAGGGLVVDTPVLDLTATFGADRAMTSTTECVSEVVGRWLTEST